MLLTKKAAYGLIAMKHLAELGAARAISSAEIAKTYGFPRQTLSKVLQHLADAGLLDAHVGIRGGYTLALDPHRISVLDVMRVCETAAKCCTRPSRLRRLTTVGYTVETVLSGLTIADIVGSDKAVDPCLGSCEPHSVHIPRAR